ncbi:MAG: hypothetical protein KAI84_06630 [Gammaproteobacteria bacterium]|nr:hypothetical protein [Gammaproteobacteria bacterium]
MNNIPEGYKQTEVGVIPMDWKVKTLGDCLLKKPEYGINATTYSNETFMQQVAAQIVWYNNSALPENLRYSLPSIEELEAELGGIHQEESGDE